MKKPFVTEKPGSKYKVVSGEKPTNKRVPILEQKDYSSTFTFSFKYFKQVRYFEIGGVPNSWFISLIERLKELSKKDWERFERDIHERQSFRYHEINWGSASVPLVRGDLDWIDSDYLNNEEDFPIIQFHVSKALGRVVGFWDAYHVFQIVLLDPMHNIQPSKYTDYKLRDTYYMSCEYSSLIVDVQRAQKKITPGCKCETCMIFNAIPSRMNNDGIVVTYLDPSYAERLKEVGMGLNDIIELGLTVL